MIPRFILSLPAGSLSLALLCGALLGQSGTTSGKRKPPPTSFSKETEDAFFRDILKERGPGRPGGAKPKPNGGGTTPNGSNGSGAGWSELVSAETLESEIKSGILKAGPTVESPAKFNTGHRTTREVYSTMALAFAVIAEYDKDVRFKEDAAGMRDWLAKSAANCKVNSEGAFQEAKRRLEALTRMRNGERIQFDGNAGKGEPALVEIADRRELMKRMSLAFDKKLKTFTSSKGEFQSNIEEVLREAEYLAMVARAIQDKSYEYSDDDEYKQFTSEIVKAALDIRDAAKQNNADAAQRAAGVVYKACTSCHESYRG